MCYSGDYEKVDLYIQSESSKKLMAREVGQKGDKDSDFRFNNMLEEGQICARTLKKINLYDAN